MNRTKTKTPERFISFLLNQYQNELKATPSRKMNSSVSSFNDVLEFLREIAPEKAESRFEEITRYYTGKNSEQEFLKDEGILSSNDIKDYLGI